MGVYRLLFAPQGARREPCPAALARPRSLSWPQIGEEGVAQIEITLDVPAAFILEFAGAIETVDEVPLRFDEREFDFVAKFREPFVMLVAVLAMLEVFEPTAVVGADRSDDGLRKLAAPGGGGGAVARPPPRAPAAPF